MLSLEEELMTAFESTVNGYTNSFGVSFYFESLGLPVAFRFGELFAISVDSIYPNYPNDHPAISLELFVRFANLNELISEFNIQEFKDLEKVSPAVILCLYERGKASIFCGYGDNSLYFKKQPKGLLISDDTGKESTILDNLITETDFINYTKRHHL